MAKQEQWKPLAGSDNYLLSNHGRIKTVGLGIIVEPKIDKMGREVVTIQTDRGEFTVPVVKLVVETLWND